LIITIILLNFNIIYLLIVIIEYYSCFFLLLPLIALSFLLHLCILRLHATYNICILRWLRRLRKSYSAKAAEKRETLAIGFALVPRSAIPLHGSAPLQWDRLRRRKFLVTRIGPSFLINISNFTWYISKWYMTF